MRDYHRHPLLGIRPPSDKVARVRAVAARLGHTLTRATEEGWELYEEKHRDTKRDDNDD